MGYLHIVNLYKNKTIMTFQECYALEKIHGTSAHISWRDNQVFLFPGGEKFSNFEVLFDINVLKKAFENIGYQKIVIFGEAYGGKQQKQSWRYGPNLRFVAFDVKVDDVWLTVPEAAKLAEKVDVEFVHYIKTTTDIEDLNAERDAPSEQARRNGVEGDQPREGVVLRTLLESRAYGKRIISKHKRDEERETKTKRKVGVGLKVLEEANSIADEWVTPTRFEHVLDKMPQNITFEMGNVRYVISAMIEDVLRESTDEIINSKAARIAISKKTVQLFKTKLYKIV